MIYPLPKSWRELQDRVAQILRECGVEAAVEKQIELARGRAVVDVWAHDASSIPPQTYIIECKRWKEAVPQHVVHAFRTIVGDSGANWGAIVSLNGFQSGAHQAANRSNVRLLTWRQFQNLFATAWVERHFWRKVAERCDNLVQYTEPESSQTMGQSASLSGQLRTEFERLVNCIFHSRHSAC